MMARYSVLTGRDLIVVVVAAADHLESDKDFVDEFDTLRLKFES